MKPYVFNNNQYENLNSLALAYKENFDLGVEDIYNNTKKFLKFVKANTKNKERIKTIVNDINLSKYKSNALTFVIFELLDVKEVVINGKSITFNQFIELLKQNPNKDNVLFAFMEDHGITRCFERLDPTSKYFKDMYFVERNYNHEFTYKYLISLFTFEMKESIDKKLMSIAIQNEECFRRSSKLVRDDQFMLSIAHIYGFREAISIVKEKNGIFSVLKLIKNDSKSDTDDESLRRMLNDSFFWWLYDNYEAYNAKGKAKQVISRLKMIKKEFSKFTDAKNDKQITKINFDFYTDVSRKLYLAYLDFVYYYRIGIITPNKDVDASKFEFDKPYCRTYITESYMAGRVVKLYNPNKDSGQLDYNPLTGEKIIHDEIKSVDIDDISDDAPLDELLLGDEDIYDREIKSIKRCSRYANVAVIFGLLNAILAALGFALSKSNGVGKTFDLFKSAYTNLLMSVGIASGLLAILFGVIVCLLENRRIKAFNNFKYIHDANTNTVLTLEEEAYLSCLKADESDIQKKVLKPTRITTIILSVLLALSCSVFGILSSAGIPLFLDFFKFKEGFKALSEIIIYVASASIGLLFGLFIRKKGIIYALLISLIAVIIAPVVIYIFSLIA